MSYRGLYRLYEVIKDVYEQSISLVTPISGGKVVCGGVLYIAMYSSDYI